MTSPSAADLCERLSHWAVLAAGVLIGSAASGNPVAIQLLRQPVVRQGTVTGTTASVTIPPWFPLEHAVFATEHGELYARVQDLYVPRRASPSAGGLECVFDLREVGERLRSRTFTLTYFPWFRFLAEPVGFDAQDSVADYVAECIRFLVVREGVPAEVEPSHDSALVRCGNGLAVEVEGMEALARITVRASGATSSLDFDPVGMAVDRRMFPGVFAMGREMLATPDRLARVDLAIEGDRLLLRLADGGA